MAAVGRDVAAWVYGRGGVWEDGGVGVPVVDCGCGGEFFAVVGVAAACPWWGDASRNDFSGCGSGQYSICQGRDIVV